MAVTRNRLQSNTETEPLINWLLLLSQKILASQKCTIFFTADYAQTTSLTRTIDSPWLAKSPWQSVAPWESLVTLKVLGDCDSPWQLWQSSRLWQPLATVTALGDCNSPWRLRQSSATLTVLGDYDSPRRLRQSLVNCYSPWRVWQSSASPIVLGSSWWLWESFANLRALRKTNSALNSKLQLQTATRVINFELKPNQSIIS
jgi:hypothetical protein